MGLPRESSSCCRRLAAGFFLFALLAGCSESEPAVPAKEVVGLSGGGGPVAESVSSDAERGYLTVFADADVLAGNFPLVITVEVEVLAGTGMPPFRFVWDFGDATPHAEGQKLTHLYAVPGEFRASVLAYDARGEIDQDYVDISVRTPVSPGAVSAADMMRRFPLSEFTGDRPEPAVPGETQ